MNRAKARLKAMLEEYGQVLSLLALLVQKYTYGLVQAEMARRTAVYWLY
jgi:hypothetical protein